MSPLPCHPRSKGRSWDRYPGEQEEEPSYEPGSLIDMVSYELTARRFAGVIRLQVSQGMPQELKLWICRQLEADPEDIHVIKGLLSLTDLARFQVEGRSDLQDPPHVPVIHPRLRNWNSKTRIHYSRKSAKQICFCIIPIRL